MVDAVSLLGWGQLVALAASLPLALIAAWGYRTAPVGRAIAALPLVSLGFLVAASDELLVAASPDALTVWHVGSALGVLGLAWFALTFLQLVSGRRRVGE